MKKEDFALFKQNMRQRYDSIRTPMHVRCLNQKVHFNARGFHHLLYDGSGKARSMWEAKSRLKLIPLIAPALFSATDSTYEKRYARKDRKKDSPSVMVEMWGLEAIVGKKSPCKIKVILRREDGGKFIFWSVMKIK